MRRTLLWLAAATGCVDSDARTLSHTFPALEVEAGQERNFICQSWTLGNDEPVYVNAAKMTAGPGYHHAN